MSELKPCPFCGKKSAISNLMVDMVLCENMNCVLYTQYIPIATWQSRPIEDVMTARIGELEGALRKILVGAHDSYDYQLEETIQEVLK